MNFFSFINPVHGFYFFSNTFSNILNPTIEIMYKMQGWVDEWIHRGKNS